MFECVGILFACYDGMTYITWTNPATGNLRHGLLALMSLIVDGGDYPWMTGNRGPQALFGCGRCRIATSLICQNVTQLSHWYALRRTYDSEMADLRQARGLRTKGERAHFTQMRGMTSDAKGSPLSNVFGSLSSRNWVSARLLAVEPLHTIVAGVMMQTQLAAIQLPQRLHELSGAKPCATSPAAVFADRVIGQSAQALQQIVAAVPTQLRHSTWPLSTTKRLITRHRGKMKAPLPRIEFRFCNGWHYRDLGRVMAVWALQPHFLGRGMHGPIANPSHEVRDFFGEWQDSTFVSQSHDVDLRELSYQISEVFCLLVCWFEIFRTVPLSERQVQDLRVLDDEFHEAAKAVLNYKATWKKHQMEEAPESKRDLGDQVTANLSESAHKLTRLLYQLCTNRSLTLYSVQLAQARNRVVAAQLLRRQYEAGMKPSATHEPTPAPRSIQRESTLTEPAKKWTLQLTVNSRQCVTSLRSSCGLAEQNEGMLLQEQGYAHLFWAILSFLKDAPDVRVEEDGRNWPLTTLGIHPSISIGQTGCPKASAATKISLQPFTRNPTRAFVRVDADGVNWFGQPVLAATITTVCGACYEIVYCKWLDFALTGTERLKLPLPTTFPLHQWAKTCMGLPPLGGRAHEASVSYGVVDASKGTHTPCTLHGTHGTYGTHDVDAPHVLRCHSYCATIELRLT
jgi:hypothetical protein